MGKRRKYLLLAVAGLAAIGLILFLATSSEPSYGGKSLSEWVRRYNGVDPAGGEALRHFGTNAIPYLMRWIAYEPTASKTKRLTAINGYLGKINPYWQLEDRELIRAQGAALALGRLRPQADACIPELGRLLNDLKGYYRAMHAAYALTAFGEAGILPLLSGLTNAPPQWRRFIVITLGGMETNAQAAVPALKRLLMDSDRSVRSSATNALRRIDPWALPNSLISRPGGR